MRGQALSTGVIEALSDDGDSVLHLGTVGASSLSTARLALERRMDEPDEALSVQAGDRLHLVQQATAFLAAGLLIASLHAA